MTTPNLYNLSGHHLHISYSTSGIDGKPHFSYQDTHTQLSFVGDQIRVAESELGQIVSVSIRRTVDTGGTTFSLLVPRVNLPGEQSIPISTDGVTTVHRFSVIPSFNQGQLDHYTVTKLNGTAAHVLF